MYELVSLIPINRARTTDISVSLQWTIDITDCFEMDYQYNRLLQKELSVIPIKPIIRYPISDINKRYPILCLIGKAGPVHTSIKFRLVQRRPSPSLPTTWVLLALHLNAFSSMHLDRIGPVIGTEAAQLPCPIVAAPDLQPPDGESSRDH